MRSRRFRGDARIGVMASGGLSHFVVDEAFDHAMIDALRRKDAAFFRNAPLTKLMSGSSEMRNWICLAGTLGPMETAVGELCAGLSHAGTQRHGAVLRKLPLNDQMPLQCDLVVQHHETMPEQPLATDLRQPAIVASRRHQLGLAVPRDDIQQVACRARLIARPPAPPGSR